LQIRKHFYRNSSREVYIGVELDEEKHNFSERKDPNMDVDDFGTGDD
jgi:hypothetical protein